MAHVSELQVQPSPLCWPQGIIVFRERCIPPCLFFMETTTKNPEMKKKKCTDYSSIITVIIIFVIIKCFHLCYQRGVTAPKCYSTSCWSPPWVSTFWRAVKNNQPKISEQERELGETNFHTVTEKEIFQKISFCLQRLLVVVERAFEWKRAKQP